MQLSNITSLFYVTKNYIIAVRLNLVLSVLHPWSQLQIQTRTAIRLPDFMLSDRSIVGSCYKRNSIELSTASAAVEFVVVVSALLPTCPLILFIVGDVVAVGLL